MPVAVATVVRSGLLAPYSAPHTLSACPDSSALMNVPRSSRIRSGLACASCSCRNCTVNTGFSGHHGVLHRVGVEDPSQSRGDRTRVYARAVTSSYTIVLSVRIGGDPAGSLHHLLPSWPGPVVRPVGSCGPSGVA